MSEAYPVTDTTAIREDDVLRYAKLAGYPKASISWSMDGGIEFGEVTNAGPNGQRMRGASRSEVLIAFMAIFAHEAARCRCQVDKKLGPCPAALRAAYSLGRGIDEVS